MSSEARMKLVARRLFWFCSIVLVLASNVAAAQDKPFSQQELEQVAAPIALYPDPLVAQVLMASTYPLEVVSAQRWVKANPGLKGKALEEALQKEPWDASVKSLAAFPQVLDMMNAQLDWTQKLGDAFLAQQQELMAAIQTLRAKADTAGNLKSGKEQVVSKEQQGNTTIVKIEPANPEVVYVPTYNPTIVYGDWPYSAYPPYSYYPPGYAYAPGAALFTFGVGMAVGAALWGDCNWGNGDININSERYNNFNRTNNVQGGKWEHKVEHRKGVGYRDNATQSKYGRGQQPGADTREAFRGRAEQGRRDLAQPGVSDRIARETGERGGGLGERGEGIGERGGGLGERGEGIGERGGGPGERGEGIGERGGGLGERGEGVGERGGGLGDRAGGGIGERGGLGDRGGGSFGPSAGTRESGLQGVGGRGAETRSFSERGGGSRAAARGGAAGGGARAGGGRAGGGGRR
jgi:hypothetical protein